MKYYDLARIDSLLWYKSLLISWYPKLVSCDPTSLHVYWCVFLQIDHQHECHAPKPHVRFPKEFNLAYGFSVWATTFPDEDMKQLGLDFSSVLKGCKTIQLQQPVLVVTIMIIKFRMYIGFCQAWIIRSEEECYSKLNSVQQSTFWILKLPICFWGSSWNIPEKWTNILKVVISKEETSFLPTLIPSELGLHRVNVNFGEYNELIDLQVSRSNSQIEHRLQCMPCELIWNNPNTPRDPQSLTARPWKSCPNPIRTPDRKFHSHHFFRVFFTSSREYRN